MSEKLVRKYPRERRYRIEVVWERWEFATHWRKNLWAALVLAWLCRLFCAREVEIFDLEADAALNKKGVG